MASVVRCRCFLVVVFVVSGVLRSLFGRLFGSVATGGVTGALAWLLSHVVPIGVGAGVLAFLFAMLTGSSRGWSGGGRGGPGWGGFRRRLGGRVRRGRWRIRRRRWRVQRWGRRRRRRRRLGELVMQLARLIRHVAAPHWRTRLKFPQAALDAIEQAVTRAERTHAGEIRFAIETSLPPLHIVNGMSPRARALEVFAQLRVWDTEHNNGVLIYVQLADRAVEIVADRGLQGRVDAGRMGGRVPPHGGAFPRGPLPDRRPSRAWKRWATLLARHYAIPPGLSVSVRNQLPDQPTLL